MLDRSQAGGYFQRDLNPLRMVGHKLHHEIIARAVRKEADAGGFHSHAIHTANQELENGHSLRQTSGPGSTPRRGYTDGWKRLAGCGRRSRAGTAFNTNAAVAVKNHLRLDALEDCSSARVPAKLLHLPNGFVHSGPVKYLPNYRHAHGHHDTHDPDHDHDFEECESAGAPNCAQKLPVPGRFRESLRPGASALRRRAPPRGHPPGDGSQRGHQRVMLAVMANMAERTLNSRKPTPTAMTTIMTGSIMFIMTLSALLSSFS